jgi:hypothetical protein
VQRLLRESELPREKSLLILTTSAGNHQAWVAVQACGADFARRLRQGSGADPSASGATRIAGCTNFKRRYAADFPMVEIRESAPRSCIRLTFDGAGR